MANKRANVVAGVVGVGAGLSAYLPSFICPGLACSSCFACVGAGGAAVSAFLVGFVSRRVGAKARSDGGGTEATSKADAAKEVNRRVERS
jgi:hypothetical protein